MLKHTFCHIPGIGEKTEKKLWEQGLLTWEQENTLAGNPLTDRYTDIIRRYLPASRTAYQNREPHFFAKQLPESQIWRLFGDFRRQVAYLDIETTGLCFSQSEITTIALYDGEQVHTYVKDRNLDDFITDINKYQIFVTFNGKCFDIPFLEYSFKKNLPQVHIDLRFILKSLGYTGGLKKCEHILGLNRGNLEGVDGLFAVLLWQKYQQTKNEKYLETLLAYNVEDVINLEKLMIIAYNRKLDELPCRALGFLVKPIPACDSSPNPFTADSKLIADLKNNLPAYYPG